LLDRSGTTEASLNHRIAQADKVFYKHLKAISNPSAGVHNRLLAFMGTTAHALLYNACGWHLSEYVLHRVKTWEGHKLRKVFRLKRAPDEGRQGHMLRTGQRLSTWFQKSLTTRCHERLLLSYHSWANKLTVFRLPCGSRPLYDLLRARCLCAWNETKDGNLWLDPSNSSGWRHARPGKQSHWEHALAQVHGENWWNAVGDPSWASSRKDFLLQVCSMWRLKATSKEMPVDHQPCKVSMVVPQWIPADLLWQVDRRCFECRVDNQLLCHWLCGKAVCDTGQYRARVATCVDILQGMVRHEGWRLRWQWSDWVLWQPRERNVLADLLANLALDMRQSIAVRCQSPQHLTANYVTVSDGASRSSTRLSSAAWALLAVEAEKIHLIAAGAVMFDNYVSSLDAEMVGLELAIGAILKFSRGYDDVVPHDTQTNLNASEFQQSYNHLWSVSIT